MNCEEWHICMEFSPKVYDIDAVGVVSNITYVRWLEDMRTEFLEQYLSWDRLQEHSIAPVLAETRIHYREPVRMGEDLNGKLRLIEMGNTSWKLEFEFARNSSPVITAEQTGVFVDIDSKNPRPLPESLRSNMPSKLR